VTEQDLFHDRVVLRRFLHNIKLIILCCSWDYSDLLCTFCFSTFAKCVTC